MTESNTRADFLAQLPASEKQQLLARLLRHKAQLRNQARQEVVTSSYVDDAVLDPAIQPIGPAACPAAPRAVLLTGATGFLGAHLLDELLVRTQAIVYCLVRARDVAEAQQKLQANFKNYFAHGFDPARVRALQGDLAEPGLGLPPQTFAALAQEIDVIFHNGAHLHHLAAYAQLKASNVSSTAAILQLAITGRPKWVHYVSSLVAAVERDEQGALTEDFPHRDSAELAGGYAQSKWVSEMMLAEAARRGIGVTIYRPGFITGRSDTGVWPNPNDHLVRVILGCLQMGSAPASELVLDMAPVDFIGAAIVGIALSEPGARVFNLSNPQPLPWSALLEWLQAWGYPLQVVPETEWREQSLSRVGPDNALFPVLPLYVGGDTTSRHVELLSKLSTVSRARTTEALSRLSMTFPAPDRTLWRRYMQGFEDRGFLALQSSPAR
jgi:thioester reductase-like protein